MSTKLYTKPVKFFTLAILITFICGFTLSYYSYRITEIKLFHLGLMLISFLGPLISALLIILPSKDNELKKDFVNRLINLKLVKPNYILFMIILMPGSILVSILISILFGQPVEQLKIVSKYHILEGQALLSLVISILVPVVEEIAWAGYGVDSLRNKYNLFTASLIFGILWGLWHLPAFFIKGYYQNTLWNMNPLFAINFFVSVITITFITNWLYFKNHRSIIITILFHIIIVFAAEIFEATQVAKCIQTIVLSAVSLFIIIKEKKFFFGLKEVQDELE